MLLAASSAPTGTTARAQPAGATVTIVTAFGAGSAADIVARLLAAEFQPALGQPVVVSNITGAAGTIAANQVVRARPDGATLPFSPIGPIAIQPNFRRNAGYAAADLLPIRMVNRAPLVMMTPQNSGPRTLADVVARGRQGSFAFGTTGVGTTPHLLTVSFARAAGVAMEHITYRGPAEVSVNGFVFLRGSPRDCDRWAQAGARGWSYEDCRPAFKRLESFAGGESELRGGDGPIHVAEVPQPTPGCRAFIEACERLVFLRNRDFNGADYEGVAPNQLDIHKGRRWSPAVGYLRPARSRPNLRVGTERTGLALLFKGRRCVGVRARRPGGSEEEHRARHGVILACGAIESPKMLMLAGIGDGDALARHGVAVRHHAPEVGKNLQHHFMVRFAFRTKPADTLNEAMANPVRTPAMGANWALRRRGHMTIGASEASLFARILPGAEEPEVQF